MSVGSRSQRSQSAAASIGARGRVVLTFGRRRVAGSRGLQGRGASPKAHGGARTAKGQTQLGAGQGAQVARWLATLKASVCCASWTAGEMPDYCRRSIFVQQHEDADSFSQLTELCRSSGALPSTDWTPPSTANGIAVCFPFMAFSTTPQKSFAVVQIAF